MGQLWEWFFKVHDRKEELKTSAPDEVRHASHELSNATMQAEGSMREVRSKADVLTALVRRMQERDHDA